MLVEQLRDVPLRGGAIGLDLCTGSGVLAIAAARITGARMLAVDVSRRAVLAVRLNARLNRTDVRPLRGDLFEPVRGRRFDLIVSNPPYLPSREDTIPRRGPARAWEAGLDGRAFIDRICADVADHLAAEGMMLLVHSSVCGEMQTLSRLREQGLHTEVVFRRRGELGPILRSRQEWLHEQGLLLEDGREEMLVIRAQAPAESGRRALAAPPTRRTVAS